LHIGRLPILRARVLRYIKQEQSVAFQRRRRPHAGVAPGRDTAAGTGPGASVPKAGGAGGRDIVAPRTMAL